MSPIVGLTDRAARLPRIGIIRKGAIKPERGPGRDQKFFRLQTEDPDLGMAWESVFGAEPTQFEVYLAYDDPDESFETCREEWVAGGLKHRCDGETCSIHLLPDGKSYSLAPVPCPHLNSTFDDPKKRPCQPIGKLRVLVPEMRRIGVFECQTHSINDIVSLSGNIALYALLARQAGRPLSGIPFVLSRREREISTPGDGKRVRRKVSLLNLDVSPKWAKLRFSELDRALALEQGTAPLQLPVGTAEETSDPDDVDPHWAAVTAEDLEAKAAAIMLPRQGESFNPILATSAQVRAIYTIAQDHHSLSESEVDERCTVLFGVVPAELSRKQASDFITSLKVEPKRASVSVPVNSTLSNPPATTREPAVSTSGSDEASTSTRKDQGARPNLEKRWNELALSLPYEAREMYFIPEVLPRTWTKDDVTEGGKALAAFAAGWKRAAKAEELEVICEVIVAIRALDGEVPPAVSSMLPF